MPALRRQKQAVSDFEPSLVYIASFRPTKDTQGDLASKTNKLGLEKWFNDGSIPSPHLAAHDLLCNYYLYRLYIFIYITAIPRDPIPSFGLCAQDIQHTYMHAGKTFIHIKQINLLKFKINIGTKKMNKQVKVFTVKHDNLNSIPWTHMVKENQLPQVISMTTHACYGKHTHIMKMSPSGIACA